MFNPHPTHQHLKFFSIYLISLPLIIPPIKFFEIKKQEEKNADLERREEEDDRGSEKDRNKKD